MPLRNRGLVTLGTVVAVTLLAGACTPDAPPSSTPSPSPSASSATPSETQFQRQEREAYEGAEKAYRDFRAEYSRVITHSSSPKVTQALRDSGAGPYLKRYSEFLAERRRRGLRSTHGIDVERVSRFAYKGDDVLLKVCEDGSKGRLIDRHGKTVGRGSAFRITLEVRLMKGRWKVWDGTGQKDVQSCE